MSWPTDPRPAKTLLQIRKQVDEMYPGRDKSSDGMLGDAAHSARTSDHNPDDDHVVKAIDLSHDPKVGFDTHKFAREVLAKNKDARIKYVISNRQIMSGSDQNHPAWQWRAYNGQNPHDMHVHISVKQTSDFFDDVSPWNFDQAINPPNPDHPTNPWDGKRLLVRGSVNDDVKIVQQRLGVKVDGIYGPMTEAAVKTFQARNGLSVDGKVGPYTWKALYTSVFPDSEVPVEKISAIAANSAIANRSWSGRGAAPKGYIKGMAVIYGLCVQKLAQNDLFVLEMAKPMKPGTDAKDALAHYSEELRAIGLPTEGGGRTTLRALFTLMLGLGMRESSGKYCEGRDVSASLPASSDTAEAGVFQSSYDLRAASPLIDRLLTEYEDDKIDGYRSVFAEGVNCTSSNLANTGSGRGALFQKISKEKPAFAVMCAAIGLRNLRKHWGPINRKEAQVLADAAKMFESVESVITTPLKSTGPEVAITPMPESVAPVHPTARALPEPTVTAQEDSGMAETKKADAPSSGAGSSTVWALIRYALRRVALIEHLASVPQLMPHLARHFDLWHRMVKIAPVDLPQPTEPGEFTATCRRWSL